MLQIYTEGQLTDLSDNISIDLVFENPLFNTDRIPATYSLSYDLPLTPRNKQIFGNPDRIASAGNRFRKYTSRILFAGIEIAYGTQTIEEVSDVITVNFSGSILPAHIDKKLYKIPMEHFKLADNGEFALETAMTVWDGILRTNMKDENAAFCAPPVAIKDVEIQDRDLDNPEDIFLNTRSRWLNAMDFEAQSYKHMLQGGDQKFYILKILPAVRVWYIIDKIFGTSLERNIFKEGEWKKLSLQSTWHPNYNITDNLPCWIEEVIDGKTTYSVHLEDFMPDVLASDFIVEMLKLPCASMFIHGDTFSIEYNTDILNREVVKEIKRDQLIGEPVISRESAQKYRTGYSSDDNGELPEGEIKDVDTILDGIHYMAGKAFLPDGVGVQTSVRVKTPRQVQTVILDNESRTFYDLKQEDMPDTEPNEDDDESEESSYDVTINAQRVECVANRYWLNDDDIGVDWYHHILCPQIDQPAAERPEDMYIGLYQGMQSEIQQWSMHEGYEPNYFPCLSSSNYGANGEKFGTLSLYWNGPEGLLERHKKFSQWISHDRMVVTAEVLFSAIDLHNLDLRDKFLVRGRRFFIRTMNVSISKNRIEPAEVEFVEADIVLSGEE